MEVFGTHSGENEYDQINENTKKVKKRAVAARQPFSLENIKIAVLKRQGVKAGVPDLHLPVPKGKYASLYIEMKYGDGRLQKEQKEFLKQAADYGNFVAVCYSQEIALKVIEDYVTLKTGEIMPIENNQVLKRWEEKKWQK